LADEAKNQKGAREMTVAFPFWDLLGTGMGAALTVWLFSFVFKDNLLYKLAEHLFIGISAAYSFVLALDSIMKTGITPLQQGDISILIPMLIGLVFFTKYFTKYGWVARFGPAFVIGIGLGIAVATTPESFILRQVSSSFLPLWIPQNPVMTITNILMTLIVWGGLTYFVFALVPGIRGGKHSTASKAVNRAYKAIMLIGIYGMMVGFGATFAATIVTRVAFLIGRLIDLIASPETSIVATILVALAIAYAYRKEKTGASTTARKP
jgi:hypothetical protein